MRKLIFLAAFLMLKSVTYADPGVSFFKGTWQELLAEAKKQNKPFFVDFYTDWCGPCRVMDKITFRNEEVAKKVQDLGFLAYKLNTEQGEGIQISEKYDIEGYPTIGFFSAQGELIGKELGLRRPDDFKELLNRYVKGIVKGDASEGIQFFKGDWSQLLEEAKKQGKPFFVDIYAEWCGPCKTMERETFTDAAKYSTSNFIAYRLDAEKGEGVQIASNYKARAYPTILFFDKNGKSIGREIGSQDPDQFLYTLEKYKKKIR